MSNPKADELELAAHNSPHAYHAFSCAVQHVKRAMDRVAREVAEARADWHDDPSAPDWADYHSPASVQFSREDRNAAIRAYFDYLLTELTR